MNVRDASGTAVPFVRSTEDGRVSRDEAPAISVVRPHSRVEAEEARGRRDCPGCSHEKGEKSDSERESRRCKGDVRVNHPFRCLCLNRQNNVILLNPDTRMWIETCARNLSYLIKP